ncbi:MAG: glycosyltransferase family 4 protein [Chloroflexota bacterium]|nr:glycosyltransferase family 4 protein [Chloroflexota bacterium]
MSFARPRVTMLVRNSFTHDSRVEKEATTLVGAGYDVTVVADSAPGLSLREERDGYTVHRVERPRTKVRGLRLLAYLRRLEAVLLETAPNILHAHDSDALQPVARAARQLDVPFVYDAHELWLGLQNRGRSRLYFGLYLAYYATIELRYLHRATARIAATGMVGRHLERMYGLGEVHAVRNYPGVGGQVVPREIRSLPGAAAIPAEAPIALHLGGVQVGRGVEHLIAAMRAIPGAHLVLLGTGDAALVERAIGGDTALGTRVHFLPPVPPQEVVDYAASATIGVAPGPPSCLSYRYSLPNKLFESMAAGLPVIGSSALPEVRAVIEHSGAGLTVDTTQPAEIAAALRFLLDHPDDAADMGRAGRQAIEERYNWSVSAAVLLEVYEGVRRSSASRAATSSSGRTRRRASSSGT